MCSESMLSMSGHWTAAGDKAKKTLMEDCDPEATGTDTTGAKRNHGIDVQCQEYLYRIFLSQNFKSF